MEINRWEQIGTLFFEALDRGSIDRAAFLDVACAGDPALREEVAAMLAVHERHEGFLLEDRLLMQDRLDAPARDTLVGSRVGPYRLKKVLGEGGMGAVYLADREGEFDQRVAVKLIRPGLRSAEVVARFRAERQILARLQHPHIARLLDGGLTDDGLPYLVMDYVDGTPLTRYSDDRRLSITERLVLFQTVCRAVGFAHRNLIVHRDLKPSNILVNEDGEIALLDFGIAKLLDPDTVGVPALETRMESRLMTPEYAAPEQVRGEAITTATDVYALGVLLYELLSGCRPFRFSDRSQTQVERMICEEEPVRPSLAVVEIERIGRSDGTVEELTPERVSAARAMRPPTRLQKRLQGDLDNIVLMALSKEAERRYSSADQMADDVARYLAGRVVTAQKDTLAYRTEKFVRRHRVGVGMAAGFLILLVGFGVIWVRQAQTVVHERDTARIERDRAEQSRLQAEEVSAFLMRLFAANDPSEALGDTVTARELLERGVDRVEELSDQPAVQARMLDVMGQVYRRLGQFEVGENLLERSVAGWQSLSQPAELARSLDHLGLLLLDQGRFDEAEAHFQRAYRLRRRELSPHADSTVAESLHNLGGLAFERGDYAAADSLFRASLAIRRQVLGEDHPLTVRTMRMQARGLEKRGENDAAEAALREVLRRQRLLFGDVHPDVVSTLNDLAILVKRMGDLAEADSLYRESLEVRRSLYGDHHPRVGVALVNHAKLLLDRDAADEAVAPLTEALVIFRNAHGPDHPDVAWALEGLARAHARSGDQERALPMYREALEVHRKSLGSEHPRLATTMTGLAIALTDLKQYGEAGALLEESLRIYSNAFGERSAEAATLHRHLGRLHRDQGQLAIAKAHLRSAVNIYREALPPGHRRTASALVSYGELLLNQGEAAEAEPFLKEGLANLQAVLPADSRPVVDAMLLLNECLDALGRHAEVRPRATADGGV